MSGVSKEFVKDFESALSKDFLKASNESDYNDFAIYKMMNSVSDWKDTPYTRAAKLEKKYLDMAFALIEKGEPAFKAFGRDIRGASRLASILKKENAERVAKATIHNHLESVPGNSLTQLKTSQAARYNGGGVVWN